MKTNDNQRQLAWSSYWADGALHSCIGSFDENYEGAIRRFWDARFSELQDDSRVLDLATGNGAIPKLLAEFIDGRWPVLVEAVDLADLAPSWHSPRTYPGIVFHSGVRMEQLPFADAQFDLVVSQYGVEYAQWPEALEEAVRVLRLGGKLAFVMHHNDSELVHVGRAELSNQQLLLGEEGLLAAAAAVLPWMHMARNGDVLAMNQAAAQKARMKYNAAMQRIGIAIEGNTAPDVLLEVRDRVHGLLVGRFGNLLSEQLQRLQELSNALQSATVRTREMIECAKTPGDMAAFAEFLRQRMPGGIVEYMPMVQDGHLLGWGIVASIAGQSSEPAGRSV